MVTLVGQQVKANTTKKTRDDFIKEHPNYSSIPASYFQ